MNLGFSAFCRFMTRKKAELYAQHQFDLQRPSTTLSLRRFNGVHKIVEMHSASVPNYVSETVKYVD